MYYACIVLRLLFVKINLILPNGIKILIILSIKILDNTLFLKPRRELSLKEKLHSVLSFSTIHYFRKKREIIKDAGRN